MSVSVLFIHRVIKDFQSNKRHMYRLAGGMRAWEYYLGYMIVEFGLYILMMVPSTMRILYGNMTTVTIHRVLVPLDFLTKASFGLFFFPALYLIGFFLKNYEAAAYQTVGLIFFFIGHQLSIYLVGLTCLKISISWMTAFLPFTFSLYNEYHAVISIYDKYSEWPWIPKITDFEVVSLNYYLCVYYTLLGLCTFCLLCFLDERSFREVFNNKEHFQL